MTQNEKSDVIQALAFAAAFLETELPPGRAKLSPWEREISRSVETLRQLHRQLSPNTLGGVAAEPARRSNYGNVGEPLLERNERVRRPGPEIAGAIARGKGR